MNNKRDIKTSDLNFLAKCLKEKMLSNKEYLAQELAVGTFYSGYDIGVAIRIGNIRFPHIFEFLTIRKGGFNNSLSLYRRNDK